MKNSCFNLMKKSGQKAQAEYAWIFSLVIGAVIIFLAVYFAGKYISTATYKGEAELLREFDTLLNPLASIKDLAAIGRPVKIPSEVELNFSCDPEKDLEKLSLRSVTKKVGEWASYNIKNKYVFSELSRGKEWFLFAKPLELPWRVDDLIYVVSKEHCFISPPEEIKEEIKAFKSEMMKLSNCSEKSVKVCFSGSCDVSVNYGLRTVTKSGKPPVYFSGNALMYAAIFSDREVYNCNLKRLMARLAIQADINLKKTTMLEQKGCNMGGMRSSLASFEGAVRGNLLKNVEYSSKEIEQRNMMECPIF